jgi:hypothetical protein
MDSNTLSSYIKDFETETKQIQYWFSTLNEIRSQTNVLKDSSESEIKLLDSLGKNIQNSVKSYSTDTLIYADEPSQLWILTSNFTAMLETIAKVFCEDITVLNEHITKYSSVITNDVNNLIKNITDSSGNLMKEIVECKRNGNNLQQKYTKLKSAFESSHLSKKKLEIDPNNLYNVTLRDKAEQKILSYLKEMKELMPLIENNGKEMEEKKMLLNKNMKESFELVIGCILKNNIKIRQALFLVSKEKTSYLKKLRLYLTDRNRKYREINFSLNDFIERKYAESKDILYESLDSIYIRCDDYGMSLNLACDNVLRYSNNFYNCMRSRKRILRVFAKLILDYSKGEESFTQSFSKINKLLQASIQSLSFIGSGSHKSWDIYKTMFDINNKLHGNFSKYLANNIYNLINGYIKDYKHEYNSFASNWNKYSKDINNVKSTLAKLHQNREKTLIQIKSLRSSVNADAESKITQLKNNENALKENIEESVKKLKHDVENSIDYLKKTVKTMREKEFHRILSFIENLENITLTFDKILDENIDLAHTQMEITANVDIYADIKEIYEKYFNTYKINENFLEKIIRKFLKNTNFNRELELFNSILSSPKISRKQIPLQIDLKQFNSGNTQTTNLKPMEYKQIKNEQIENEISAIQDRICSNGLQIPKIIDSSSDDESNIKLNYTLRPFEEKKQNNSNNRYFANAGDADSSDLIDQEEGEDSPIEDDKLQFVDTQNFKVIDSKKLNNFNVRENDLKDYYDKLDGKGKETEVKEAVQLYEDIFPIDSDEKVLENYNCAYSNRILLQGRLYITTKKIVFYSWFNNQTLFGTTKLIVPKEDIVKIEKKKHLKIFDNSISITTKKSKLFFTSFVSRDICYIRLLEIYEPGLALPPAQDDADKEDNFEGEHNDRECNKSTAFSKGMYYNKFLKRINFYKRLDEVHQKRLQLFESSGQYRLQNTFPKTYFDHEYFSNVPISMIYKSFFDNETTCDEFERNKSFWESLFEMRNDTNIIYELNSKECPKFYDDMEYMTSLFVNLDEETINEFLNDIEKWTTKSTVFNYKFIHPIKKKLVGPDRLKLKDEYNLFFISPKLLIIEIISYGSDFPYADCFIPIVQYRFNTEYKYSANENIFKFKTDITISFKIEFVKSCLFKSIIESEGFKESEENLRFNTYEKMKTVIDKQAEYFNEHFVKMNEEHLRKATGKLTLLMGKEVQDEVEDDVGEDEIDDNLAVSKMNFTIEGGGGIMAKFGLKVFVPVYVVSLIVLMILFGKIKFNIGLDKIINGLTLVFLGFLVYKLNYLKNLAR